MPTIDAGTPRQNKNEEHAKSWKHTRSGYLRRQTATLGDVCFDSARQLLVNAAETAVGQDRDDISSTYLRRDVLHDVVGSPRIALPGYRALSGLR